MFDAAVARDPALAGRLIAEHLRATASLIVDSSRLASEKAVASEGADFRPDFNRKLVPSSTVEDEDCGV